MIIISVVHGGQQVLSPREKGRSSCTFFDQMFRVIRVKLQWLLYQYKRARLNWNAYREGFASQMQHYCCVSITVRDTQQQQQQQWKQARIPRHTATRGNSEL